MDQFLHKCDQRGAANVHLMLGRKTQLSIPTTDLPVMLQYQPEFVWDGLKLQYGSEHAFMQDFFLFLG